MTAILLALAPVVLLALLGAALRRGQVLSAAFWPQAERLGYYVLLPALFLHGLTVTDFGQLPVFGFVVTLLLALCSTAALVVALRRRIPTDGPGFTSVFQGAIRFNNYIGITLAVGLFGDQGIAYAGLANAVIVPTVNLLSVLVFARFGGLRPGLRTTVLAVLRNPLLLACAGGIALHLSGLGLPPGVGGALKALGAAALPLGLLCVGAALEFRGLRGWGAPILISSLLKFGVLPAATWAAARLIGLDAEATRAVLMFQSLPTASSSYILARQLGGNAPMMAAIIAAQTVLAALTMPVALALAGL
ncbi:AEC family transporter [Paenirhodobacter sp.]|uniref:AEC family transporter n=1 Tax=Paenirhodobacter sp. TaxID=1965326 RepID=UPI003B50BA94